jgi:hypothetical protein
MNSDATLREVNVTTEFISNIRTGTTYPNVAPEFISDIRRRTTYPNVAHEFISDIRTGTTYPNVATDFMSWSTIHHMENYKLSKHTPILISEMNSCATLG